VSPLLARIFECLLLFHPLLFYPLDLRLQSAFVFYNGCEPISLVCLIKSGVSKRFL
jgi:hypothetical protein